MRLKIDVCHQFLWVYLQLQQKNQQFTVSIPWKVFRFENKHNKSSYMADFWQIYIPKSITTLNIMSNVRIFSTMTSICFYVSLLQTMSHKIAPTIAFHTFIYLHFSTAHQSISWAFQNPINTHWLGSRCLLYGRGPKYQMTEYLSFFSILLCVCISSNSCSI